MPRPLISPAKMARLRGIDERAMPSTCRVLRRTDTVADGRVASGTETPVGSNVACRSRSNEVKPRERAAVGRVGDETFGEVSLPIGTDVKSQDRIEVTTPLPGTLDVSMETFEVVGDPWPESYSTSLTVAVQRED